MWRSQLSSVGLEATVLAQANQPYTTWSEYAGGAASMQYSALKQINKSNVSKLELAFFYPAPGPSGRFAFSPLVVDGVMYVVGKDSAIFAIDAATGKEIWTHSVDGAPTNRGFNYWESKDRSDRRIVFSAASYLQELDAKTGRQIMTFGINGVVNLRENLGRTPQPRGGIQSGSPGHVFENMIILGSAPYRAFIEETLEQYPRLRATRICDMIRERGYKGSVYAVRRLVRKTPTDFTARGVLSAHRAAR